MKRGREPRKDATHATLEECLANSNPECSSMKPYQMMLGDKVRWVMASSDSNVSRYLKAAFGIEVRPATTGEIIAAARGMTNEEAEK